MKEKNELIISIPLECIPVKEDGIISSGQLLCIPDDVPAWFEKLERESTETQKVYINISSQTDCPQTFTLGFTGYPGDADLFDLREGREFGFELNLDAIERLHDALGYLIKEERREGFSSHKSQEEQ